MDSSRRYAQLKYSAPGCDQVMLPGILRVVGQALHNLGLGIISSALQEPSIAQATRYRADGDERAVL
jgi:hypothetical protein